MSDFPSTISDLLMWVDGRSSAYSDTAGTALASAPAGRARRINYGAPAVGNAQAPSDPARPYREASAFNFQTGGGHYLQAPVASNCQQNAVTIAVNFSVRDKPEGSPQVLICNGALNVWLFSANNLMINYNGGANNWLPAPAGSPTAYVQPPLGSQGTLLLSISATDMQCSVILDGVRTDYVTPGGQAVAAATTLSAANWRIGWDGVSSGDYKFHGAIAQALVIPRAVPAGAEREGLLAFLAANPAPHYCPTDCGLVTICGDSIARAGVGFFGVPLESSWAMLTQQLLDASQPVNLVNGAISGSVIGTPSTAGQYRDVFLPILQPFYSSARAKNIFVQAAGTNDMAAGALDGPTTLARDYALQDAALAAGFRTIGTTVLKRIGTGHDAAFETARSYKNTHLLAEYAARGYAGVIDFGGIPEAQDPSNTTWFSDGIHPTTALHALMAQRAAPVIQAALADIAPPSPSPGLSGVLTIEKQYDGRTSPVVYLFSLKNSVALAATGIVNGSGTQLVNDSGQPLLS